MKTVIELIMKRKSHERTVGTLISTVCYFILAAFFALQASDFLQAGDGLRGWALAFARRPALLVACGMSFMIWLKS